MSTKIDIKHSNVAGVVPTTSSLNLGEIAINTYDGRVFIKKDNGTPSIVEIGGGGASGVSQILTGSGITISPSTGTGIVTISSTGGAGTPGGSNTQIQFNGNGAFSGSSALTFNSGSNTLTLTGSLKITGSTTQIGNQTITGSILMSGSSFISGVDYIDFDTTASNSGAIARLKWNDTDGTLDLGLKGGNVTLQIGQEQLVRVVNKTATNITLLEANYQAVRLTGAQGQRLKVDLAQATSDSLSAETLGLVTETIANNQEGFVTTSGLVRGIDTTGTLQGETWSDGDVLYLSPTTAGNITNIKPVAPNHLIVIGYVVHAHNTQGTIFVKVDNGYEIDELHNVLINTGSLTSGQLLVRSGSVWINSIQLTGSYGLTGSLTVTQNISASSFTGSLFGTATTASYVLQAVSASYASTASYVVTALTASYVTASNIVGTVTSASYALTASNILGGANTYIPLWSGSTALSSSIMYQNGSSIILTGSLLTTNTASIGPSNFSPGTLNISTLTDKNTSGSVILSLSSTETGAGGIYPTQLLFYNEGATKGWSLRSINQSVAETPLILNKFGNAPILIGTTSSLSSAYPNPYMLEVVSGYGRFNNGLIVTGSLNAPSITGSLQGTASWANNVVTSSYASTASFVISSSYSSTASYALNAGSSTFPYTGNAVITGSLTVSGSTSPVLKLMGSGSAILQVTGSLGGLFQVSDTNTGNLFSVQNSTGNNLFVVSSSGDVVIGIPTEPSLYTTTTATLFAGITTIYSVATSSYRSIYFDYNIMSASNARAGQIMAMWSGSSVNYTEVTTTDFGDTSGVVLGLNISGANMILSSSAATANWTFNSIIRSI